MLLQIKQRKCFSRAGGCQAVVCVSCLLILCSMMVMTTGCRDEGSAMIITVEESEQATTTKGLDAYGEETVRPEGSESEPVRETAAVAYIYVHVCGQVVMPGVYSLPKGSRVWDAVEAAGGFLPEAVSQAVNLAMVVADGSKVTIPNESEAGEIGFRWYETDGGRTLTIGGSAVGGSYDVGQGIVAGDRDSGTGGRVNINRADVDALMTIPGIGQTRAEAIVAYREIRGPFSSIEEIMQVTGIKEGLFAKIKEYITVGG